MSKSGMYGEMPKLIIGKFSISKMSDKEGDTDLWIEDTILGEGGQFRSLELEKVVGKFYEDHF